MHTLSYILLARHLRCHTHTLAGWVRCGWQGMKSFLRENRRSLFLPLELSEQRNLRAVMSRFSADFMPKPEQKMFNNTSSGRDTSGLDAKRRFNLFFIIPKILVINDMYPANPILDSKSQTLELRIKYSWCQIFPYGMNQKIL